MRRQLGYVRTLGIKEFCTSLDFIFLNKPPDQIARAVVEGVCLGLYQYTPFKTIDRDKIKGMREFAIIAEKGRAYNVIRSGAKEAEIISRAVCLYQGHGVRPGERNDADRYGPRSSQNCQKEEC